jgi:hypothetical protein
MLEPMNNEDRINAILAKAADAERQSNHEAAPTGIAHTSVAIENAWLRLRNHLDGFVREMDGKMPNYLRPNVRQHRGQHRDLVDALKLTLGQELPGSSSNPRCFIDVAKTGDISVRIGTSSQMPVRMYPLHALTAVADDVKNIVLDFIEANI